MKSRFARNVFWIALVSAMTCSSFKSGIAARCSGFDPPPSRKEPALANASVALFGPIDQVTRQPG